MLQGFTIKQQSRKALLLFIGLILAGCSQFGPYVELEEPDPMPPGPGLFSGETGVITIKNTEKDANANKATDVKNKTSH